MLLILDGVSKSSFKRSLPNTLAYLKTYKEFFLFDKHHVTGENTFQNLMPLLCNLNETETDQMIKEMYNITDKIKPKKFIDPP